jgi:hypothetical protein
MWPHARIIFFAAENFRLGNNKLTPLMIYKSFSPGPPLSEFIRNYTIIHFQFPDTMQAPFKQRSPKPEQKIIFYINGSPKIHTPSTGNVQTPPPVSIFSHQVDKRIIKLTTEFYAFLIFLKPGVLYRLTRLPMTELLNEYCDAELFFGTEVRAVSNQLVAAKNHPEMISAVEQFLLRRCRQLPTKSPIDEIASCLTDDPTFFYPMFLFDQRRFVPNKNINKFI